MATVVHLSGGNIIVLALYLHPGLGVKGKNQQILITLGSFLSGVAGPWIIIGDWNQEPAALQKTGWPTRLGGEVIVPEDCQTTCDKGETGSLIDFALAKLGSVSLFRFRGYPSIPWKTHTGLQLDIKGRCKAWWHHKISVPPSLPVIQKPKKRPDPNSKRGQP